MPALCIGIGNWQKAMFLCQMWRTGKILLFFLMQCILAFGREAPCVRNFTPTDYNAQNQNWSLAQSPKGWIYAGNNGSLLEFDGARWQSFFLPEKQTVRAVAAGPNGEIFCGGFAEFGYWKMNGSGRMVYTSLSSPALSQQLHKEEIWHILVLPDCVLFQSFSILYKYDYQKVTAIKPPEAIMFAASVNGRVLLPVIGQGVFELLPDNSFRFLPGSSVLQDKIVQFLVPGPEGSIWIGTTSHGVYKWKDNHCEPWENPLNAELRKNQINKAIALKNGGWVIGTILNGAYILDASARLSCQINRANGLQNNTVLSMLEDLDGNLWLGLDKGVDFVALQSPLTFFNDQTGKIGAVYTAVQWADRLYLGTNQGVFVRTAFLNGHSEFQLVEGTQGQVWNLQVFDDQLICGHNSGTFVIEKNNSTRKISEVTGGWCTLQAPGNAGILIQSTYTGLIVFEKNAAGKWQFSRRITGFVEPLKKAVFDTSGNLWGVHPYRGLFRLRLSSDWSKVVEYRAYTREDKLPSDFKLGITRIGNSVIVNTDPVPCRAEMSGNQATFTPLTAPSHRQKWLSGSGSDYFVVDSNNIRLMTDGQKTDLLLTLVPGFENIVVLRPQVYLFCLENGFALLERQDSGRDRNELSTQPVIRYIEARDGTVWLSGGTERLKFDWGQNSLLFRFAAPFFERAPKFSWKLEGFSEQWSVWQPAAEKEFTNLPAGNYTFRVRTDTGGQEAVVAFRIAPPWYLSGWAAFAYSLIAFAIFWAIEIFNRRRLQSQRLRLEAEKEHEILVLEIENKSRELSNAALNLIRKNEALQSLKDDLLESRNEPRSLQKIVRRIDEHLEADHDWEIFEASFNRVHDDFFKRLMQHYPDLTPGDLRLAAYLKMNLSSKEIAPLLNISIRGVENKRYRLRKKTGLPEDANLTEFMMRF